MTIKKGLKQNCLCDYTSPNQCIENVLPIRTWLAGIGDIRKGRKGYCPLVQKDIKRYDIVIQQKPQTFPYLFQWISHQMPPAPYYKTEEPIY